MGFGLQHRSHSTGSWCFSAGVGDYAFSGTRRGDDELQFGSRCDKLAPIETVPRKENSAVICVGWEWVAF